MQDLSIEISRLYLFSGVFFMPFHEGAKRGVGLAYMCTIPSSILAANLDWSPLPSAQRVSETIHYGTSAV